MVKKNKDYQESPHLQNQATVWHHDGGQDVTSGEIDSIEVDTLGDRTENEYPADEAEEGEAVIRVDLHGIINHVLSSLKNSRGKRPMSNFQGKVSFESNSWTTRRNKERDESSHNNNKNENENGGKKGIKYHYHTARTSSEERWNLGKSAPRVHRQKRSASNNNTLSMENSTRPDFNASSCVFMSRRDLMHAINSMAASAVNFLYSETTALPSKYTTYDWLRFLEMVCILFFAIEFLIRFIFALSKITHLLSFFTIIDFVALVAMLTMVIVDFIHPEEKYTDSTLDAINCFQIVRVFRLFRLVKDVVGFQVLMYSIRSSWKELLLLVLYIVIAVTVCSTLIFYAEKENMNSIPEACWWAIVTMTTVGYGDIVPITIWGRLIGVGCALSGILLIAVTVPIFVNNFLLFYEHSKVVNFEVVETQRKKSLASDSFSDTTSAGVSSEKNANGKDQMSREESVSDNTCSKTRLGALHVKRDADIDQ